jgi:SAM-dependent methyltransferase
LVPDSIFADPRLASIHDDLEGERADLDHYEAIVDELDAATVLDIGCGTGVFANRLAARGLAVIGVDPAQASLDVARRGSTWLDRRLEPIVSPGSWVTRPRCLRSPSTS